MAEHRGRAVRFDRYGDLDRLHLVDQPLPEPGPGEAVVAVLAAGINPVEDLIRSGARTAVFDVAFPSGQGTDLAGIVLATGTDVRSVADGDAVLGWSRARRSQATYAVVPASDLVPRPAGLDWAVAGSLFMVGSTATAAVAALDPRPGTTVAVSAAAGGVGALVVQLLVARGVRVLGIAAPRAAGWLIAHGATPIPYDAPLRAAILDHAPGGVDGFIDLFGPEYLDLAMELGVPPDRIETTASIRRAHEIGAHSAGNPQGASAEVLAGVARAAAAGDLDVPIAALFPLEQVREAFAALRAGHSLGKIVLLPDHDVDADLLPTGAARDVADLSARTTSNPSGGHR